MANKSKEVLRLIKKHYEPGITLITPTGDRPISFAKTEEFIKNTVYDGPLQWIVVDDGVERQRCLYGQHYLRNMPLRDKAKSLTSNLITSLNHIIYNKILIIEDDDYYSPEYIYVMSKRLDEVDLVGDIPARYYNVKQRVYRTSGNRKHASLAQTGFTVKVLEAFFISCQNRRSAFVDFRLWNKNLKKKTYSESKIYSVGIKGMPGRAGIGSGHRPNKTYQKDKDLKILGAWVKNKDLIEFYAKFYEST